MARDEVARLVADVSRAVQSSDLLSLLQQERESSFEQQQYTQENGSMKRSLRRKQEHQHSSLPKCLSEIPKSILDDRVEPIRTALLKIDAQKLLNLEILEPPRRQYRLRPSSHERAPEGPRVRDGVYCRPIIDQIRPRWSIDDDVAMGDDNRSSVVRYLHIAEVPDEYTIGIFVFGPNERIPLHDHPEMCVLSRVLYGDLKRLSLDLDRGNRSPNDTDFGNSVMDTTDETNSQDKTNTNINETPASPFRHLPENQTDTKTNSNNESSSTAFSATSWLSKGANWLHNNLYNGSSGSCTMDEEFDTQQQYQYHPTNLREERYPDGTKFAYRNAIDVLMAPDVASLYPYEGNLHEFVAGPYGAAVLDVLLPPYDEDRKRDCTFYHTRELPKHKHNLFAKTRTHTATATVSTASNQPQEALHHSVPLASSLSPSLAPTGERNHHLPERVPCLIVPTGQPEDFHCISGRYKDLGETDDYYDDQYDDG